MSDIKVPENIEKINREDWVEFLNTSKEGSSETWSIIGVGITDKSIEYNAETTEEKWIIEGNKRKTVDSYGLSSGVEQTAYKGDPVFDYVDNIRYRLLKGKDAETTLLEIDKYSAIGEDSAVKYRARKWKVGIEISSNGGDSAKVNYNINYLGDPTFGTVTFSEGTPTFEEETK
ncbi:MAG: hypothetical protein ACLUWN_01130 [Clostridia bacterium]|jgi:hypothetical protein|nr:MAG TPA: hypothetical protein [Caudoviricetes sp.]